jgi:hypothetical protein
LIARILPSRVALLRLKAVLRTSSAFISKVPSLIAVMIDEKKLSFSGFCAH